MEKRILELDRRAKAGNTDHDNRIDYHGDCVQPARRQCFMKAKKIDGILSDLSYDLRRDLEDAYGIWDWHPGMG